MVSGGKGTTNHKSPLMDGPSAQTLMIVLLALLLISTLVWMRKRASSIATVVIVGRCNSGKTALWLQMFQGGQGTGTVASMEPNEAEVEVAAGQGPPVTRKRTVRLVDIPGHPRVRQEFKQFSNHASGVVFVVDAVDFLPHVAAIGEHLYEVMNSRGQSSRRKKLQLLLAVNKSDYGVKAHSCDFVRRRLEQELNTLRSTRLSNLPAGDGGGVTLGQVDQPVTFALLAASGIAKVTIASISATTGDVQPVWEFVRTCTS